MPGGAVGTTGTRVPVRSLKMVESAWSESGREGVRDSSESSSLASEAAMSASLEEWEGWISLMMPTGARYCVNAVDRGS